MLFSRLPARQKLGFTLTEIAIVMAIVGIILAGVWAASSQVSQSNKIQKSSEQMMTIIAGYRTMFASRPVDTGAGWVDITCNGVTGGFFPSEMVQSGACAPGPKNYPLDLWSGIVYVWGDQSANGIAIQFPNLSQAGCVGMANAIMSSPDLINFNIDGTSNGTSPYVPWSPTTAPGLCTKSGNANWLWAEFKAN
jgi:prepilin-type N-terminal cleavage/methylation domain-containing protein